MVVSGDFLALLFIDTIGGLEQGEGGGGGGYRDLGMQGAIACELLKSVNRMQSCLVLALLRQGIRK